MVIIIRNHGGAWPEEGKGGERVMMVLMGPWDKTTNHWDLRQVGLIFTLLLLPLLLLLLLVLIPWYLSLCVHIPACLLPPI